jgi:16S rRNA (cytosine967-C5)-methyltransferase
MYFQSYLSSASQILKTYDNALPFAAWLKYYFKQNKKFGSTDRKQISDLCFCYYRLGSALTQFSIEERLLTAQFLCQTNSAFIKELKPEWVNVLSLPLNEKLKFIGIGNLSIFPFADELSSEIDKALFNDSHLIQPDLFLRIRPGKKQIVNKKLEQTDIQFSIEEDCVRLSNNTKIDDVLEIDKEIVVQDRSSQQVLSPLKLQTTTYKPQTAWDCCAASGGKSILLYDYFPGLQLTVSDIRESIILNLKNRFKSAGIQRYESFIADVSSAEFSSNKKFDVIICDAPCSGSGTWGRTPEQLIFFRKEKIEYYANLQKKVAVNAARQLKQGGVFLYITCSVLKKENEEVVNHILENTGLQLVSMQYFKGYTEKADTLFAALFSL